MKRHSKPDPKPLYIFRNLFFFPGDYRATPPAIQMGMGYMLFLSRWGTAIARARISPSENTDTGLPSAVIQLAPCSLSAISSRGPVMHFSHHVSPCGRRSDIPLRLVGAPAPSPPRPTLSSGTWRRLLFRLTWHDPRRPSTRCYSRHFGSCHLLRQRRRL